MTMCLIFQFITHLLDIKALHGDLHRTYNMHDALYNCKVIEKAMDMVFSKYLRQGVQQVSRVGCSTSISGRMFNKNLRQGVEQISQIGCSTSILGRVFNKNLRQVVQQVTQVEYSTSISGRVLIIQYLRQGVAFDKSVLCIIIYRIFI